MDNMTVVKSTAIYTLPDVAMSLDISVRTLQRAIAAGELAAVRAGRHTFVTGRSLLAWLEGDCDEKGDGEQ